MKILDIFINDYCNLHCSYCSSINNISKHIPFENLKKIDISKYNVINILGGEPLLHPEIIDILNYFNSFDKTIILYTNGLKLKNLKNNIFNNINVLLTFHIFGPEVVDIYNYCQNNKFYKNIRYQMLYTKTTRNNLLNFNENICSEIYLGYDIDLPTDTEHFIKIKKNLSKFNLFFINKLFLKKEENMIRTTSLINTDSITPFIEIQSGFQYCLLKDHFIWRNEKNGL